MARYIDADKIVFWIRYVSSNGMLCDTDVRKVAFSDEIARMPTADVAPRAEVAREIFEEIEEYAELQIESLNIAEKVDLSGAAFFGGGKQAFVILLDRLAELKKKYTEPESPDMKGGE